MSRAWPSLAVKSDCEQWEDLSVGTGHPREDHGPCHEKTAMGDDVLVLRMHLSSWEWRMPRGKPEAGWTRSVLAQDPFLCCKGLELEAFWILRQCVVLKWPRCLLRL